MGTKPHDKVLLQTWVPQWVKDGLQREAREEDRSVSKLLSRWLLAMCAEYPEAPHNRHKPPPSTPQKPADEPAPFQSPVMPQSGPRHQQRSVEELPDFEDLNAPRSR